jgi:hypothetical protein
MAYRKVNAVFAVQNSYIPPFWNDDCAGTTGRKNVDGMACSLDSVLRNPRW